MSCVSLCTFNRDTYCTNTRAAASLSRLGLKTSSEGVLSASYTSLISFTSSSSSSSSSPWPLSFVQSLVDAAAAVALEGRRRRRPIIGSEQ
jgi:hypothetical protein